MGDAVKVPDEVTFFLVLSKPSSSQKFFSEVAVFFLG